MSGRGRAWLRVLGAVAACVIAGSALAFHGLVTAQEGEGDQPPGQRGGVPPGCYRESSLGYLIVCPSVSISANPMTITQGRSTTLSWRSSWTLSRSINQGIGSVGTSGTRSVSPSRTTKYTITGNSLAGTHTASVTVTVRIPPTPTPTPEPTATPTPQPTATPTPQPTATPTPEPTATPTPQPTATPTPRPTATPTPTSNTPLTPPAVSNLRVTQPKVEHKLRVTWQPGSGSQDLAGYRLQYRESGSTDDWPKPMPALDNFEVPTTPVGDPSWIIPRPTDSFIAGKKYDVRVQACNYSSQCGPWSEIQSEPIYNCSRQTVTVGQPGGWTLTSFTRWCWDNAKIVHGDKGIELDTDATGAYSWFIYEGTDPNSITMDIYFTAYLHLVEIKETDRSISTQLGGIGETFHEDLTEYTTTHTAQRWGSGLGGAVCRAVGTGSPPYPDILSILSDIRLTPATASEGLGKIAEFIIRGICNNTLPDDFFLEADFFGSKRTSYEFTKRQTETGDGSDSGVDLPKYPPPVQYIADLDMPAQPAGELWAQASRKVPAGGSERAYFAPLARVLATDPAAYVGGGWSNNSCARS